MQVTKKWLNIIKPDTWYVGHSAIIFNNYSNLK